VSLAWRNGRFVPRNDPGLPTLTGSVGRFETILVTAGEPRFLSAHLARLLSAAGAPDGKALAIACRSMAEDGPDPGRMRVMLDEGGAAVTLDRFDGYPDEIYEGGVTVVVAPRPGHPLGDRAGTKPLPYTPLLDARSEARRRGAFDVLFIDRDGFLLEGSACNLFVVTDGRLRTPPVSRPILPGITRAVVLTAAARLGIPAEEADVRPEDLLAADEAFLTGSLMEVVPIRQVGDAELPRGDLGARLRARVFGG